MGASFEPMVSFTISYGFLLRVEKRRKQCRCPQFISLFKNWGYLKHMYLIELDETNRLSLISSFYLNPFQSYSQKTIFVNRSKGHNSHIVGQIIIKPMFLVELDERNIFLEYCLLPSVKVFPPEPK